MTDPVTRRSLFAGAAAAGIVAALPMMALGRIAPALSLCRDAIDRRLAIASQLDAGIQLDRRMRMVVVADSLERACGDIGFTFLTAPTQPRWDTDEGHLVWRNGATANYWSVDTPELSRGQQYDLAIWAVPGAAVGASEPWRGDIHVAPMHREAWDELMSRTRLGSRPEILVLDPRGPLRGVALRRHVSDHMAIRMQAESAQWAQKWRWS